MASGEKRQANATDHTAIPIGIYQHGRIIRARLVAAANTVVPSHSAACPAARHGTHYDNDQDFVFEAAFHCRRQSGSASQFRDGHNFERQT